jgi:hypothetical protein
MPPQQANGLLDRFDERFGFGAHSTNSSEGSVASDAMRAR